MDYDSEYEKLMADFEMKPLTYKEVVDDWEKKSVEWYHASISMEDLSKVLTIPGIKIYSWCRCKLVAEDGTESHFHWHGLLHFSEIELLSWKKQLIRTNMRFLSNKNTFKKILCLDHLVGVLRYIACDDGKGRARKRNADGLLTSPHKHYYLHPIDEFHRHQRGKLCSDVRNQISENISNYIKFDQKPNWNKNNLHDVENCICKRGKIAIAKKVKMDEKRRAFFKSVKGIKVRRKYRERDEKKTKIINVSKKLKYH